MEPQFGIVAILDALGVSSYSITEAQDFISQKNLLLDEILNKTSPQIAAIANSSLLEPKDGYEYPTLNIAVFGDTIILCWPTKNEDIAVKLFPAVATLLQRIITVGILRGILLRGAISIGQYLSDEKSTILGPAISDAYSWSEEADWFGVILTPHFRMVLGYMLENEALNIDTDIWAVPYSVPLHNSKKDFYVIAWPAHFLSFQNTVNTLTPYASLCKMLSTKPIPKGTESKYENTLAFFKWYEQNIHAKIPM